MYLSVRSNTYLLFCYILLTVHHVMILGKWPTWRANSFLCSYLYFNSLHVSSTSCSSSGINLHTTRPPKQSDSYQRLY